MARHLVLMVHGIGEQHPGDTVDEFVGAACSELDVVLPVDSGKVLLSELDTHRPTDQTAPKPRQRMRLFPCHTRRVATKAGDEVQFAEVFWADLSRAPRGAIQTAVDLMHVIFGLGYIALDNVEKNSAFRHPWIASGVHAFVWLFYTMIAPINAILFIGALALLADPYVIEIGPDGVPGATIIIGVGLFAAAGAWLMRQRVNTYLTRSIRFGLCFFGWLSVVIGVMASLPGNSIGPAMLRTICAVVAPLDREANLATLEGNNILSCYVGAGVFWLNVFGLIGVLLLLGLTTASVIVSVNAWWTGRRQAFFQDFTRKRSIYLAACAALMVLATFFIIGFWVAFEDMVDRLEGDAPILLGQVFERHFGLATLTFGYIFVAALWFVVVAVVLVARRFWKAKQQTRAGRFEANYDRLIANCLLTIGLPVFVAFIAVGAVYAGATWALDHTDLPAGPLYDALSDIRNRLDWIHGPIDRITNWALVIVGVLTVIMMRYSDIIGAGLGVARDIAVYSTRSRAAAPDETITGTRRGSRYVFRERIEARFAAVVDAFATPGAWDSIAVVSHSQGTVIASRGLRRGPVLEPKPTLVTMGSPLAHIYCHYFDQEFCASTPMADKIKAWLNIFRCDDYVGTYVNDYDDLLWNHSPLPVGGHQGYWSDRRVWDAFKERHRDDPEFNLPGYDPPLP